MSLRAWRGSLGSALNSPIFSARPPELTGTYPAMEIPRLKTTRDQRPLARGLGLDVGLVLVSTVGCIEPSEIDVND